MEELRYQIDLLTGLNHKLSESEKMYRLIFDTSFSAFLYYDYQEQSLRVAGNWNRFFAFDIKKIKDLEQIFDTIKEEDHSKVRDLLSLDRTGKKSDIQDFFLVDKGIWVECEIKVYYDENNRPIEKLIRFENVTKYKLQNEELTYLAYYDSLTGLYNRNYFVRLLNEWIRKAENESTIVSVLFIDIDDFRKINDGLGIIAGDELVQLFGQFLYSFHSENVIVSHFNSDIYCMAIYEPCGSRSVENIYREIQKRLHSPFALTGHNEMTISVCLGVAEFPEAGSNAFELINYAEIVMFKAKSGGKNAIQYFDEIVLKEFLSTVKIEHKLKEAIVQRNFFLTYQPQYDPLKGTLRGVEALIRWQDTQDTMISPSVFIPIAERNGTIIPIGNWVLNEALKTFSGWIRRFDCKIILSLNISPVQYKKNDFVAQMIQLTKKYEIDPSYVELEITESIFIEDFEDVIYKMRLLRENGFRVSLDDFGTGFSSLAYLKDLPIDTLKIDKTFIDTIPEDESSKIIVESVISMVKKLGFDTVAEGVERQEQLEYLKKIQCNCIQGYLLGRPEKADVIERIIVENM